MNRPAAHETFLGVQILRFVAAVLVVVCHSSLAVSERMSYLGSGVWEKGGIGVSIFFVISGFVIVLSAEPLRARADGWKTFAYRRLIRIVPLYWIVTTLKLLTVLLEPAMTLHTGLRWPHVAMSYLFLPSRNPLGVITPLHAVGWTLIYEMFFYATFCAALLSRLPPTRLVTAVFGVLIAWGLLDPAFSRSWSALVYTSPLVLEFLLGMLIANFVQVGGRLPPAAGLCGIVLGTAMIWHFDVLTGWPAFFCHGIPSALIVAGVVFIEPWLSRLRLALPLLLGEASYALYLFHPFVVAACGVALARWKLTGAHLSIAIMTLSAIAASIAVHVWIDAPITRTLKGMVRSRRAVMAAEPSLGS